LTIVSVDGNESQSPAFTETQYEPASDTVIDRVVAPFDQRLPVAEDDVNVTLPPWQNAVSPEAETVGVVGNGFTVTVVAAETAEAQVPLFTETE
jgi:hypothetical protein